MLESRILKGRYSLEIYIKEGSDTVVYKGIDIDENRPVAIKILKSGNLSLEEVNQAIALFHKELEFFNTLKEPYIPKFYDLFYDRGNYYLIMEWIEGETLSEQVKRRHKLPQDEALRIMYKIAEFIAYVDEWGEGKIFKEIKPSNIIIDAKDCLKIIDFGTARIFAGTSDGKRSNPGTPGYYPPEAASKEGESDSAAEVYSIGATIYHLVTGVDPSEFSFRFPDPRKFSPELTGPFSDLLLDCLKPKSGRIPDTRVLLSRVSRLYFRVPSYLWVLISLPVLLLLSILLQNSFLQIFPDFLSSLVNTSYLAGSLGCFSSLLVVLGVFLILLKILMNYRENTPILYAVFFTGVFVVVFYLTAYGYLLIRNENYLSGCTSNCSVIGKALKKYTEDHRGKYPVVLRELVPDYLPSIPLCPVTGSDTYSSSYTCSDDRSSYTFFCSGSNHMKYLPTPLPSDWPRYDSVKGLIEKPGGSFRRRR